MDHHRLIPLAQETARRRDQRLVISTVHRDIPLVGLCARHDASRGDTGYTLPVTLQNALESRVFLS